MSEKIKLKGMTWNHERGVNPLIEASKVFEEKTGVCIEWDARSLSDFELFPLDILANKYDFIMIDHPHIGVAHEENLLKPLETLLSAELLKEQEDGTVGQSYKSYTWDGHQYALPLDSAAQVCAYRKDLLEAENAEMPVTWEEVFTLAEKLPKGKIAIPFVPVHAYSSFFTMCSHFSDMSKGQFWSDESDLSYEVGEKALDILVRLMAVANEKSKDCDPINILDIMKDSNEIAYTPLIYGYSNYSRKDYGKYIVTFRDMPKAVSTPQGSMIGGVGLSISSKCQYENEALEFVKMAIDPDFQRTVIYTADGQPGHIKAWKDDNVNAGTDDFFIKTLDTLAYGSLRPRFNGYIDFQAEAGKRIRDFCVDGTGDKKAFIDELNALIKKARENKGLQL